MNICFDPYSKLSLLKVDRPISPTGRPVLEWAPTEYGSGHIFNLPNEILITIGAHLSTPRDVYHLILVSRRFTILIPRLHDCALQPWHCKPALWWAVLIGDRYLAKHILEKSEEAIIVLKVVGYRLILEYNMGLETSTKFRAPNKCDDETLNWVMDQGADLFLSLSDCSRVGRQSIPLLPVHWELKAPNIALLKLALFKDGMMDRYFFSEALYWGAAWGQETTVELVLKWAGSSFESQTCGEVLDLLIGRAAKLDHIEALKILSEVRPS